MYDTLIIGAGMSGLAAGIRLAYYDQRVCILEQHYSIGGLNSFYHLRGRDYDVGLHAVTNYVPPGTRRGPLARLLKQLRFRWDDFALAPQVGSRIAFPDVQLDFNNDIDLLRSEVAANFPEERDNFERFLARLIGYDDLDHQDFDVSTRQVLSEVFTDPLLMEMLLCPVMMYGSARENDLEFGLFCILFRSIFLEGLGRPLAGVRLILRHLVRRFRSLGGELRLRSGVKQICADDGHAVGVVLDNGEEVSAQQILSSAGRVETMRLCGKPPTSGSPPAGKLSLVETVSTLNTPPDQIGCDRTMVFYNDSKQFSWACPSTLCDEHRGVICSPNNFRYDRAVPEGEGVIRVSTLANYDRWQGMSDEEYGLEKIRWYDRLVESAVRFVPDFRSQVIDTDMFTPKTIRRFTCHENGAVYGAPDKQPDGCTHLSNLFLCGADTGLVGIVGAINSGITMANRYCLNPGQK